MQERSRRYWRLRYGAAIAETACLVILLAVFISSGLFRTVALGVAAVAPNYWVSLALFVLVISAGRYLVAFPVHFYSSFILEHSFGLTRQKTQDWFRDEAKAFVLSCVLSVLLAAAFYALVLWQPGGWWWMAALVWIFFSLVLARLVPIVFIPLFFKYSPVSDARLRSRIMALAQKMGVPVLDVFRIDYSRKTLKANAALLGWGKTRRVILSDTLSDAYTPDEIEAILAHEFAHQKLRHLLQLLLADGCGITICLYVLFRVWHRVFAWAGVSSLEDLSGLVLVIAFFSAWGILVRPAENFFSRRLETAADRMSLSATSNPQAFVSLMEKLAAQNLADRAPSPLAKFFFFDHPPVEERIAMARQGS